MHETWALAPHLEDKWIAFTDAHSQPGLVVVAVAVVVVEGVNRVEPAFPDPSWLRRTCMKANSGPGGHPNVCTWGVLATDQ